MKSLTLHLLSAFAVVSTSSGALFSYGFDGSGALTSNAAWTAYNGADASLTESGGVVSIGSGAEDVGAQNAFAAQTGNIYAGLDVQVTSTSTGDEYTFGFLTGANNMAVRWGFDGENASTYTIDFYNTSGSVTNSLGTVFNTGTTYRFVIGFDGVDTHRIWVDPGTGDFGSPAATFTQANANDPSGFFFRQGGTWDNGGAAWTADNLIISTDFAEAVIPEPTGFALAGLGGLLLILRRRR